MICKTQKKQEKGLDDDVEVRRGKQKTITSSCSQQGLFTQSQLSHARIDPHPSQPEGRQTEKKKIFILPLL